MRESELIGFNRNYMESYKLRGFARWAGVEANIVEIWFEKIMGKAFGESRVAGDYSYRCGKDIEFDVQEHFVLSRRDPTLRVMRWHVLRMEQVEGGEVAAEYLGNVHVSGKLVSNHLKVRDAEFCFLRERIESIRDTLRKDFVPIILANRKV